MQDKRVKLRFRDILKQYRDWQWQKPRAATLVTLIAAACVICTQAQEHQDKKFPIHVRLESLPEPFTNAKLPETVRSRDIGKDEICYNLIGCFEKIPISWLPKDPQDLKTEFRIYNSQNEEILIALNRSENCLQSKPNECDTFPFDLKQLIESPFDVRRRTIVVIGGYFSKAPSNWELRVKDLWIKLEDVNVIIVSWIGGNSGLYDTAATNTRPVARQLIVLLYYLAQLNDLNLDDDAFTERIHIVGHSLGAHIAGFVGQDLGGRVGRITGLDPAGPQFDKLLPKFRLDKSDAQLVDVMHTNAGSKLLTVSTQYGTALASGHVDFYANNGQHQPACSKNELMGCSHKKAIAYYEAFLNHELGIREQLKCKSCLAYRLRAFASDSYENFHNGLSLRQRCPATVLDDDLFSPDLNKCSIPIDFISWFDVLRDELQTEYGLDFSEESTTKNKYYYYTNRDTDDQTNHYLVKIRMVKQLSEQSFVLMKQSSVVCDFRLDIELSNGMRKQYDINNYEPIDELDQIIVPFLSPDYVTKYELAKMDKENFYLDEEKSDDVSEKLRTSIEKVLPRSIKISCLGESSNMAQFVAKKDCNSTSSLSGYVKRLFKMTKCHEEITHDSLSVINSTKVDPRFGLPIRSISVEPLHKMQRHLSAMYSSQNILKPNIRVLKSGQIPPEMIDLSKQSTRGAAQTLIEEESASSNTNLFYIHTTIVGPRDEGVISQGGSGGKDADEVEDYGSRSKRSNEHIHTSVSKSTWFTLAMVSCSALLIVLLIAAVLMTQSTVSYEKNDISVSHSRAPALPLTTLS